MLFVSTCLWEPTDKSFDFSRCYSEQWVERLYDGVKRNLSVPFEFVLFTDKPRQLNRPIRVEMLERRPIGYGSMIEPFKLAGPSIIVGLDTVVTGSIDHLARYCMTGDVMLLPRDPFFPEQACNGVALVPKGYRRVWDEWSGENDMEWARKFPHAYIEHYFPGQVESYKGKVRQAGLGDARIVYFHGKEKPHELAHDWVKEHWGGPLLLPVNWQGAYNNDHAVMLEQYAENAKRDVPFLRPSSRHGGTALIVGGGPSLKRTLGKIRFHQSRGGEIFALNGTHDWLIERGIIPDYHVLLDSRQSNICFVQKPHKSVKYLVGAQCHPDMFEALKGFDVTLWFHNLPGAERIYSAIEGKPVVVVDGGATVGCKAMYLAYTMGYRHLHFFGFDSCYEEGENHAYPQPLNANEDRAEFVVNDRTFICAPWMAKQAKEFQQQMRQLLPLGVKFSVHGDGLIPYIMEIWNAADRNRRRGTVG